MTRRTVRTKESRYVAQAKFLREFPSLRCFVCGERAEPGQIYKWSRKGKFGKPWLIHEREHCKERIGPS